jgi:hypothetical protein
MIDQKPPKSAPGAVRSDRLGAALRENLKRRKAQAKGRAQEEGNGSAGSGTGPAPNSAGFPRDKPEGNA